jgi:arylsulfatase A-like enzyme
MEHVSDATVARISNSFDNSIVHIDGLVRRSIEALERLGILEDSVVIVTSDHGESLGEHHTFFHGTSLYDEQVHVPLLVRVGSHLSPAHTVLESRRSSVVGHIDLVPTILHLLTGQSPGVNTFEGVSLLSGYRKPYELLLFRGIGEKVAIATEDRKYIFDVPGQRAEEYSLRDDPDERQNLWRGDERSVTEFTGALVKRGVLSNPPLQ